MRFLLLKISSLLLVVYCIVSSCNKNKEQVELDYKLTPFTPSYPSYFPQLTNIPENNPLTVEGIELGRKLYYDPILSNTGQSCSSCHNQAEAFSFDQENSLPHINLGWNTNFLWNGRITGQLEDIMLFEVDIFFHTDLKKINASNEYRSDFRKVYHAETITSKDIAYALAQFFRTLISGNSTFDKFVQHEVMLSPSEMRGFTLFNTEKGDCFHCHSLGLFTDNKFHNIGLDSTFEGENLGRYVITGNPNDKGLFKSPTLRNVEYTAPYMHDGRFQTLEEVVEHYNSKVKLSSTVDPIMTKMNKGGWLWLSVQDKADLVAFLKTLSDSTFITNPAFKKP